MRRAITICAALTLSGLLLNPSSVNAQDRMVSLDDVVLLAQSNISAKTILTFLQYRQLNFTLDADALQQLRAGGVSEEVIRTMLELEASSVGTVALAPAYVVATGYRTVYPPYYYGARFVGTTAFPLGWYSHRYYHHGYTSIYNPDPHSGAFSDGVSHSGVGMPDHDGAPAHFTGTYGGDHQVNHISTIGHSSTVGHRSNVGHSIGRGVSHSTGH